jgi:hypothetical protein
MGTNYGFQCDNCEYVTQNEDDHVVTDDGGYFCLPCSAIITKKENMSKTTKTSDEIINEIAEVLRQGDGEFIERIANQVLVPNVTYLEDSLFEHEVD